jgi:hypothetical protein
MEWLNLEGIGDKNRKKQVYHITYALPTIDYLKYLDRYLTVLTPQAL